MKSLSVNASGTGNPTDSCEIPYRSDEKYWVVSSKSEVTISFALQFDNQTDRALARIFLLVKPLSLANMDLYRNSLIASDT